MKIAITGASGYIGSFLREELQQEKDRDLLLLSSRQEAPPFVKVSYDDPESLQSVLAGTDILIHLAAIKKVASFDDASENISMTRHIIDAACTAGVKQVIYASSISVYSGASLLPWSEDISERPETLYGMSKLTSEHIIRIRCSHSATSYTNLRLAHIIGDHMPGSYMMPVFFKKAASGEDITILGRSTARREFVHVSDVCRVISRCIDNPRVYNQTINVGCGSGITNEEAALSISRFCPATHVNMADKEDNSIVSSYMDVARLKALNLPLPCDSVEAIRRICMKIESTRQAKTGVC
ncbi:MAG: SDR family oxidoreductase [Eubacterium sp.]|nr:SDR family oxidoreductase [Eubacterium sp.]